MAKRRDYEPSAWRTGLVHAGLSITVFGSLGGALGAGVHLVGDPDDASPRQTIALFDTPANTAEPELKARLESGYAVASLGEEDAAPGADSGAQPDLGVEYDAPPIQVASLEEVSGEGSGESVRGIRINGKLVRPGESYNELTQIVSLPTVPAAGLTEKVNGLVLPKVSPDGRAPADVYARPFANPGNRPVVSIIVGGLGVNAGHTKTAIEDLPPEVTLSFAPHSDKLQYWINKARAAGHEVLIEVPMEAHDYGRMKMPPQALLAGAASDANLARLDQTLSRATGYFGVINYQGAKFAGDTTAASPVLASLSERGLAFIEDGSLDESGFGALADQMPLRYARANFPIDTKLTAVDISTELMELEALASSKGAALGSAFAFPLTIDMVKTWCEELESKGLVLAPASALAARAPVEAVQKRPAKAKTERVRTGSLSKAPVDRTG